MKIDNQKQLNITHNWFDSTYLLAGAPRQQEVYRLLSSAGLFDTLREYSPCLAGTIPLQVDIPESDADIICEVNNHAAFEQVIRESFGCHEGFTMKYSKVQERAVTLAQFVLCDEVSQALTVEIFGQSLPVEEQNAYRHLVVEARLLRLAHKEAHVQIRRLKSQGIKTEPAFAQYFGITGEPYQALLDLYDVEDDVLHKVIQNCQDKCQIIHTL
ncbi:MAG: DUF4269 domain-containing protein [Candidatus Kapabacteria bacterium]|nr:DUF4269 domain-containing protein [Candidatus Kapabacteria bacterium]